MRAVLLCPAFFCGALLCFAPASQADSRCSRTLHTTLNGLGNAEICMANWLRAVFSRAECQVQIAYGAAMPPGRLLHQVEHGQLDFILGASPLPERAKWGWFSLPYSNERIRLVSTAKAAARWPVTQLCDTVMQKARVYGPAVGWYGAPWAAVQNGARCGQVTWYRSTPEPGGELLKRGRVDLVLVSEAVFPTLNRYPVNRPENSLAMLPLVVSDTPVVMLFSRASVLETDLSRINTALHAELQAHGAPCGLPAVSAPTVQPAPEKHP